MAGKILSSYMQKCDPRRGCGGASPFMQSLGYSSAKSYQYTYPETSGLERKAEKFNFWKFLGNAAMGAVTGGVTSAAFYGAGKGIEKLVAGLRVGKSNSNSGKYQKASFWEKFTKRNADVNELHVNPLDEFSNPKIGPCESAVAKYIKEINQTGKLANPIEVQKLVNGGYEMVDGHHRWLAATKTGLEKVPIRIKNYSN